AEQTVASTLDRRRAARWMRCQTTKFTRGDLVFKNKIGAFAGCAVLALGLAACGSSKKSSTSGAAASSSGSATISGAGSTFAAPVYQQWASALSGMTVNYQAVGSGAGITALESKTVDFGASDPPLKAADEEAIAKSGSPAVQIPMFLGAITVSYNLPGVQTGLKMDGKAIADIFLGKVEQAYALQHKFTYASVKNKAGKFVAPSLASTSAAAAEVAVPANLGIKISNPGGAGSYPITSQTFIVVNKDLCKAGVPGGK